MLINLCFSCVFHPWESVLTNLFISVRKARRSWRWVNLLRFVCVRAPVVNLAGWFCRQSSFNSKNRTLWLQWTNWHCKHRTTLKCLILKSESQVDIFYTGRAVSGGSPKAFLTHGFLLDVPMGFYNGIFRFMCKIWSLVNIARKCLDILFYSIMCTQLFPKHVLVCCVWFVLCIC